MLATPFKFLWLKVLWCMLNHKIIVPQKSVALQYFSNHNSARMEMKQDMTWKQNANELLLSNKLLNVLQGLTAQLHSSSLHTCIHIANWWRSIDLARRICNTSETEVKQKETERLNKNEHNCFQRWLLCIKFCTHFLVLWRVLLMATVAMAAECEWVSYLFYLLSLSLSLLNIAHTLYHISQR